MGEGEGARGARGEAKALVRVRSAKGRVREKLIRGAGMRQDSTHTY